MVLQWRARSGALAACGLALLLALCVTSPVSATTKSTNGENAFSASKNLTTVRYALLPSTGNDVSDYVGIAAGIFKKYGINLQLVSASTGPTAIAAVISGSADIVDESVPVMATSYQSGLHLQYFCGLIPRSPNVILVQPGSTVPDISKAGSWQNVLHAMKGVTYGVPAQGSAPQTTLEAILKAAGLPTNWVKFVAIGAGSPAEAAFESGEVQAMTAYPFITQTLVAHQKGRVVMKTAQGPSAVANAFYTGFSSSPSWLSSHRKAALDYCKAIKATVTYMKNPAHRKVLEKVLKKEYNITTAGVISQIYKTYFPTISTAIDRNSVQKALNVIASELKPQPPVTTQALVWSHAPK